MNAEIEFIHWGRGKHKSKYFDNSRINNTILSKKKKE